MTTVTMTPTLTRAKPKQTPSASSSRGVRRVGQYSQDWELGAARAAPPARPMKYIMRLPA